MKLYRWTKSSAANKQICWLPEGQVPQNTPRHHATGLPYGDGEWSDNAPDAWIEHAGIYQTVCGDSAISLPAHGVSMSINDAVRLRLITPKNFRKE